MVFEFVTQPCDLAICPTIDLLEVVILAGDAVQRCAGNSTKHAGGGSCHELAGGGIDGLVACRSRQDLVPLHHKRVAAEQQATAGLKKKLIIYQHATKQCPNHSAVH